MNNKKNNISSFWQEWINTCVDYMAPNGTFSQTTHTQQQLAEESLQAAQSCLSASSIISRRQQQLYQQALFQQLSCLKEFTAATTQQQKEKSIANWLSTSAKEWQQAYEELSHIQRRSLADTQKTYARAWQTATINWPTTWKPVSPSPFQNTASQKKQATPKTKPMPKKEKTTPVSTKKMSATRKRPAQPQTTPARSSRASATASSSSRRAHIHRTVVRSVSR